MSYLLTAADADDRARTIIARQLTVDGEMVNEDGLDAFTKELAADAATDVRRWVKYSRGESADRPADANAYADAVAVLRLVRALRAAAGLPPTTPDDFDALNIQAQPSRPSTEATFTARARTRAAEQLRATGAPVVAGSLDAFTTDLAAEWKDILTGWLDYGHAYRETPPVQPSTTAPTLVLNLLAALRAALHLPPTRTGRQINQEWRAENGKVTPEHHDLRLHLFTVHGNVAAAGLGDREAVDQHHHEHYGPGGIRNHDFTSHHWTTEGVEDGLGDDMREIDPDDYHRYRDAFYTLAGQVMMRRLEDDRG